MRVYNRRKAFAKKSPLLQKNCKVGKIEVQERQGFPLRGKLAAKPTDEGKNCGARPFARRGEVTPPYGARKIHRTVGAGYAPPAT